MDRSCCSPYLDVTRLRQDSGYGGASRIPQVRRNTGGPIRAGLWHPMGAYRASTITHPFSILRAQKLKHMEHCPWDIRHIS
jgi:hypothetical protein